MQGRPADSSGATHRGRTGIGVAPIAAVRQFAWAGWEAQTSYWPRPGNLPRAGRTLWLAAIAAWLIATYAHIHAAGVPAVAGYTDSPCNEARIASSINAGDWRRVRAAPVLIRASEGWRRPRSPLFGGDAAGVVEAVGEGVTRVRRGDHVALSWTPWCGACPR